MRSVWKRRGNFISPFKDDMLVCWVLCRLWGCKNMAFSISWLEVIKGIPNQGIFCSVSYSSLYLLSSCVCPSVCPSVTSRSCTKMAKPRITLATPYDSPGTLVFRCQKSRQNSNNIPSNPQRVRQIELG